MINNNMEVKIGFINDFPVWLRIRLLSAGLETVLSQTEKSCMASNYRQFSTNIKIKIIKLIQILLAWAFGAKKLVFTLIR